MIYYVTGMDLDPVCIKKAKGDGVGIESANYSIYLPCVLLPIYHCFCLLSFVCVGGCIVVLMLPFNHSFLEKIEGFQQKWLSNVRKLVEQVRCGITG